MDDSQSSSELAQISSQTNQISTSNVEFDQYPTTPKKRTEPNQLLSNGHVGDAANSNFEFQQGGSSLPFQPTSGYPHLPTPQSPTNFNEFIRLPKTPETPTPLSHASNSRTSFSNRLSFDHRIVQPRPIQQMLTPEQSPFVAPTTPPDSFAARLGISPSNVIGVPSVKKLEFPPPPPMMDALPMRQTPPPSSPPLSAPQLSSPFVAKRSPTKSRPTSNSPPPHERINIDHTSSITTTSSIPGPSTNITTSPRSPPASSVITTPVTKPHGGEIDRIRQAALQEQRIQLNEIESRRPEYLKRSQRSEADQASGRPISMDDGVLQMSQGDRLSAANVGITDSPAKGRRLKLFQETSEESFEESLMAGGYGRYRTAEWVRQPQPVPPNATISLPLHSTASPEIINVPEESTEPARPPTEKELKKRKRLEAFRGDSDRDNALYSQLYPTEWKGKGRVLYNLPAIPTAQYAFIEETGSPTKKKYLPPGNTSASGGGQMGRRKKKDKDAPIFSPSTPTLEDLGGERPNWPDEEFPWKLRTDERAELVKAEQAERLKRIEKFLERDTDDEDEGEEEGVTVIPPRLSTSVLDRELVTLALLDEEVKAPPRMGRGKMVPLRAHVTQQVIRRRAFFPSDPADAKAALLSKRSVRQLSWRQEKRRRKAGNGSDSDIVCTCRGTDDGRELVQCDECKMWFHLQCLGIRSIAELGREEDPWFCKDCTPGERPFPDSDSGSEMDIEPTFAPTDDRAPLGRFSVNSPFLDPPHTVIPVSPSWGHAPRTPPRHPPILDASRVDPSSSTSTQGPRTPRHQIQRVFDGYDDLPFDPTSTPSRGTDFHIFQTPKRGPIQTPSRPPVRRGKSFDRPLPTQVGDNPASPHHHRMHPMHPHHVFDESPIRRTDVAKPPRRILLAQQRGGPLEFLTFEEASNSGSR